MSSFIRTIQRERKPGSAAKLGRGSKLGTKNPKDPCVNRAFKKAPKVWRCGTPQAKPAVPAGARAQPLAPRLSKAESEAQHKARMLDRRRAQDVRNREFATLFDHRDAASINRHGFKPHEHRREIARRSARGL